MRDVAVLFARADSIYKQFNNCDVYDIERDARTYTGGLPIIAHPPCRAWGQLSHLAKPRPDEKELAIWVIWKIRENGGILEHPLHSKLWGELALPKGKEIDKFGGFSLYIDQFWFGHKAKKPTLLYICGIKPDEIPEYPLRFETPTHLLTQWNSKTGKRLPEVSKAEREATPVHLAEWLIKTAVKTNIYENSN